MGGKIATKKMAQGKGQLRKARKEKKNARHRHALAVQANKKKTKAPRKTQAAKERSLQKKLTGRIGDHIEQVMMARVQEDRGMSSAFLSFFCVLALLSARRS